MRRVRPLTILTVVLTVAGVVLPAAGQDPLPAPPALWTGGDALAANEVAAYAPGTGGDAEAGAEALGPADCVGDPAGCAVSIGYGGSIELTFGVPFTGHSDDHVDLTVVECCNGGGSFNEQAADGYEVAIRLANGSVVPLVEVPDGGTITLSLDGPFEPGGQRATEFTEITGVIIRGEGDFPPQDPDPHPGPDIDAVIVHRAAGPAITEGEYRGTLIGVEVPLAVSAVLEGESPDTRLVVIGEESRFGQCGWAVQVEGEPLPEDLRRWNGQDCDGRLMALMSASNGADLVVCALDPSDGPQEGFIDHSACGYFFYQGPLPPDPDPTATPTPTPTATAAEPPGDGHPAGAVTVSTGQSNRVDDHIGYAMILSILVRAGVSLDEDESAFAQSGGAGPGLFLATTDAFPDALSVAALSGVQRSATLLVNPADRFFTTQLLEEIDPRRSTVIGGTAAIPDDALPPHPDGAYPRFAGANRFDTAARIALSEWGEGPAPEVLYVATGVNYPDALAGGAIASLDRAPILLVERDRVPAETGAALEVIRPQHIVLLGGDAVISDTVGIELAGYAQDLRATRVFGSDRTQTAVALSQRRFPNGAGVVTVVNAEDFRTAEQAASLAWATEGPLLLVRPGDVPPIVSGEIRRLAPRTLYIVNDRGELSDQVVAELEALMG